MAKRFRNHVRRIARAGRAFARLFAKPESLAKDHNGMVVFRAMPRDRGAGRVEWYRIRSEKTPINLGPFKKELKTEQYEGPRNNENYKYLISSNGVEEANIFAHRLDPSQMYVKGASCMYVIQITSFNKPEAARNFHVLFSRLIDDCKAKGINVIETDADARVAPIIRRIGFVPIEETSGMERLVRRMGSIPPTPMYLKLK
jgi:hypothetical protein